MSDYNKEKRRFKRYNVDSIHGNMIFSSDVNIVNISIDGVAIETTKRLNLDKEYSLKVRFKDVMLNLKGLVVWSVLSHTVTKKTGEVLPVYKAGLRFTNVLNDKSSNLLKFIDENKIESIERRMVGVRFKVRNDNGAIIDYPYEYHIKKISLAGMLIETANLFVADSRHDMEIYINSRVLAIAGRIVNCVEHKTNNVVRYDTGVEFMKISDEDRNYLKGYLDDLEGTEKNI